MASLTHKGETKILRDSKCKLLPLDFVGSSISCALMSRTPTSQKPISLNTQAFSSYTLKLSLRKWLKTISKSSSYLNWPTTLKSMCHLKTSRRFALSVVLTLSKLWQSRSKIWNFGFRYQIWGMCHTVSC